MDGVEAFSKACGQTQITECFLFFFFFFHLSATSPGGRGHGLSDVINLAYPERAQGHDFPAQNSVSVTRIRLSLARSVCLFFPQLLQQLQQANFWVK